MKEAIDAAIQSAMISVMSSWEPDHARRLRPRPRRAGRLGEVDGTEETFIAANLTQDGTQDVRQPSRASAARGTSCTAAPAASRPFTEADAVIRIQAQPPVERDNGTHVFHTGKLCIAEGTTVKWVRMNHTLTYDVSIEYPFATFEYRLDGQLLEGNQGVARISKEVSLPEFDPDTYKFMRWRQETRNLEVTFARTIDPGGPADPAPQVDQRPGRRQLLAGPPDRRRAERRRGGESSPGST